MSAPETIHAGCIVVNEAGLLVRGPAGSGKSTLAREVLAKACLAGRFARLVSDDRTRLEPRHGRLVAGPVAPLGGFLEIRGLGIVRQPFEPAAVVRLVVDLGEEPPRFPDGEERNIVLCGIMIPRIRMRSGPLSAEIALACLSGVCDTVVTP